MHKGINVPKEDVIYNWTDMSSMTMSKAKKLFWATKKVHSPMLQAFSEVCSKAGSFVVDLFASTCLHLLSYFQNSMFLLVPFPILTFICVVGNNIRACHTLRHHILVLELDIDIFIEMLNSLVEVPTLDQSCPTIDLNNSNSTFPKHLKRNLVCE